MDTLNSSQIDELTALSAVARGHKVNASATLFHPNLWIASASTQAFNGTGPHSERQLSKTFPSVSRDLA